MKKILKYSLRGFGIFIGLLLLLYLIAYIYVVANKKELIGKLRKEVSEKITGDVQIEDIDIGILQSFPSISILLEKVSIKDTMFNVHHHPFFVAEKVYCNLSINQILHKSNPLNSLTLEKAQLYIYTDTAGYTNGYLLSPKKTDTSTTKSLGSSKLDIESIRFKDVRLVMDNRMKGKLFDFEVKATKWKIEGNDSIITVKTKNDILVHNLMFNQEKGSFLKETPFDGDFILTFNKSSRQLRFTDIDIALNKHPFNLTGVFTFVDSATFSIKILTKNIKLDFARNLLAEKLSTALSLVKIEEPVNEVLADISGPLKGSQPLVNIQWKLTSGNTIEAPFASFSNCTLNGSFTNEHVAGLLRRDENSRIEFHDFKGDWQRLPIVSKSILIDNLAVPVLNADVKSEFDLTQLNTLLASNTLELQHGKGLLDLTYSGPLINNSNQNTLLNGKLIFSDGLINYFPKNIPASNVNAKIIFKNSDVYVSDFRGNIKGNKIIMNGSGKNLLALMETNPGKAFLEWNIYSPSLNLESFTSLLKKRTAVVRVKTKSKLGKTGDNIDRVVSLANFRLNVKADEMTYSKFKASNVRASLDLINEDWVLNNVSLQHAGGLMTLNGYLTEKNSKQYEAGIKVNMQNMDVNKVMYGFNNFGQDGITANNLRGKLTSHADVTMDIDRDLNPSPANIKGYFDFSLKDGALLHYEPLTKIQKVVFKKRNFDEVFFAELKDRLDINNGEIKINRMEIQSTVLTLYAEGIYSLHGNNTDISIQVPLSNLKKRGEDYTPENQGTDKKGGMSVYVRGRPGSDGKVQFKLDVFKKLRKKDKKKKEG